MSQAWAGSRFGGIHLPRIGQEVIVDFKNGDPDLPIIIGRMWNADNLADWNLPSQKVLSGFRSRELGGSMRANKLVLDDTAGQIQAVLSSDHQESQLSLGYLTHIPSHAGRTDKSGEGFALRTDSWGSIRAGDGLILSTWSRPAQSSSHMDSKEAIEGLEEAGRQMNDQSGVATQQQADPLDARSANAGLVKALSGQATAELTQPVLALSSPAGIVSVTPASTHISSSTSTTLTTGAQLNFSVGRSWVATVAERISLFVQKMGFKLIAMRGDILIDAQNDNIRIRAKNKITLQADEIELLATTRTTVNGGGSWETLTAGQYTHHTNGLWAAHAMSHTLAGPDNAPTPGLPDIPKTKESLHYILSTYPINGRSYALHPYTLYKDGASVAEGVTDAAGKIVIDHEPGNRS